MWPAVSESFATFLTPMEGRVNRMYRDSRGLVTVGIGNLVDDGTPGPAINLPRYGAHLMDGDRKATDAEIVADWTDVKNGAHRGRLTLTEEDIDALVGNKTREMERHLTGTFPDWESWPADAQMSLLSLAWAQGPSLSAWPRLVAACRSRDWSGAARQVNLSNSWMVRRNAINRGLLRNAWWSQTRERPVLEQLYLDVHARYPVVRHGDTNEYVSHAQHFLVFLGYPGPTSGSFDDGTLDQVTSFQTDEKNLHNGASFANDGIVGNLTWAALGYQVPPA